MKKLLSLFALLLIMCGALKGQGTNTPGKPIAEIFTDFHYNFNDTASHTGFGLNRAYLGYQFIPEGSLSGKVIINIGSPEELAEGSTPRRYAYCREASITWSDEKLSITMGITGTRIFAYQQKFWGKRYVANTYQSINGYGFIADLGIAADYILNDWLSADFTLMNGEGYSNLQLDDNLRSSLGFTITPTRNLAIRIYGDIQRMEGLWQPVFVGFAGFKNDMVTIGGEISYKSNIDLIQGHHAFGISATGGINLSKKTEFFLRYDYSSSVILKGDALKWNYLKDGSFAVAGVQYSFSQDIKIALNYQGKYPYSTTGFATDMVIFNTIFRF
jgi:hypothetical protein